MCTVVMEDLLLPWVETGILGDGDPDSWDGVGNPDGVLEGVEDTVVENVGVGDGDVV